jgi:DNA-binding SARP family transcriptional activator/TolB-like protein
MYHLRLLGGASLEGPGVPVSGRGGHRHHLALLALLAEAGEKGCSRDKVVAFLWPESDAAHARHRLSDSLYSLRRATDADLVVAAGEMLWLNRDAIRVDAAEFQDALERGDREGAVGLYGGPFLDGFHLGSSREFEEWLGSERARLADLHAKALESLARHAEEQGDPARATEWWRQLLVTDPFSSPVVLSLMEALAAAGDPANAIQQAAVHERLLRAELDVEPPAEIAALVERLRSEPAPPERAPRASLAVREPAVISGGVPRHGVSPRIAAILAGAFVILLLGVAGAYVLVKGWGKVAHGTSAEPDLVPTVAVVPFAVHGPGMELWREGLVDLLSVNLDGPMLRAIDSRTVMARWRERVGAVTEPDFQAVLDVARATEARDAVIGTAVSSGHDVRLTAEIVDLETGERVGQVRADGPADSMITLVDALSIELLRVLLRGRAHGSVDLAARTTRSVEALGAFLDGEQLDRRGQYEAASGAYARAVAADSMFALAWYRLGLSRGWIDVTGFGREDLERAEALSGSLPPREVALLRGALAVVRFDADWIDSARALADRYPDDAEAWFLLGELCYHQGSRRQTGYEETERAFQRSVQLDPTSAPHYLHLVDLAFVYHADSALAAERIARYRELAPRSPHTERLELSFGIAFGGEDESRTALSTLEDAGLFDLIAVAYRLRHPRFWPRREPLLLFQLRVAPDASRRSIARTLFLSSVYQRGWFRRALAYLDDPVVGAAIGPCDLLRLELDLGVLPEERLEGVLGREAIERAVLHGTLMPEERARTIACGALYAARRGRAQDYAALRKRLVVLAKTAAVDGDTALARDAGDLARTTDGLSAWLSGDPEAAYRTLVDFPPLFDFANEDWWGRILLESGRPALAIPYFIGLRTAPDPHLYLGKAYEALGRDAEARDAYEYFLRWWADADPEIEPLLDEARRGLARVRQRLQ